MTSIWKKGVAGSAILLALWVFDTQNEANACQPGAYVGSLCVTTADFCPRDYAPAQGQVLPIDEYTLLYATIGPTYGGDAHTTIGLPYTQGRELIGAGQAPGLTYFDRGDYTGIEQIAMHSFNLPAHTHGVSFSNLQATASVEVSVSTADKRTPQDNFFAATPDTANYNSTANKTLAANSVQATLTLPHTVTENTPPSGQQIYISQLGPQTGFLVCIAVDGIYPPRPQN